MRRPGTRGALLFAAALAAAACAPRLRPLVGAPAPATLPRADLPPGHHHVVFQWTLEDADLSARGEGAARIASPDSARLDFFLAGGAGSGAAVMIDDDLRLPSRGDDMARRLLPPAPLLWGALGRVALPALPDTVARVDSDTLRADIGSPVAWRVTFVRGTLRRIERVDGGRVVEWVERFAGDGEVGAGGAGARVRYRHEVARRRLDLTITRTAATTAFDAAIWTIR